MYAVSITVPGEAPRRECFDRAEVRIGRIDENDLVLEGETVSRRHARIVRREGKFIIVDLKSTHGTWVNGRKITSPLVVKETDRVTIGDFSLQIIAEVERPAPIDLSGRLVADDATEAALIRAIVDRDPGSRLVYADWLDEQGDKIRAEFLRVQDALATMDPSGDVFRDRSHQLRGLAKHIDIKWRVRVSRPTIDGCAMDYECPRDWGALEGTERPDVRFCNGCQKTVHYTADVETARAIAANGMCVAIDLVALRWNRDVAAPYGKHVCSSCDLDVGPDATTTNGRYCPRCGRLVAEQMLMGLMA